jgi:CheY-like chemotaxis protein
LIEEGPVDKAVTRPKLVLVDDDRDHLEALSIFFEEKYTVFGYASAMEATEAIGAVKPDVMVLDIGMRPVDGMQCLQAIRAAPENRDIPAVALTGFARDVERQRFLDGGFQAVVVKPVLQLGELVAVIDRLLSFRTSTAAWTSGDRRGNPSPSTAAAHLDDRAPLTASRSGDGETGRGPRA